MDKQEILLLTVRKEDAKKFFEAVTSTGEWLLDNGFNPIHSPKPTGHAVAEQTFTFTADALVCTMNEEGKKYFKVKGEPFTQYGVTVWHEVLSASGIDDEKQYPGQTHDIAGWTAEYTKKEDGKNGKVVRLYQ